MTAKQKDNFQGKGCGYAACWVIGTSVLFGIIAPPILRSLHIYTDSIYALIPATFIKTVQWSIVGAFFGLGIALLFKRGPTKSIIQTLLAALMFIVAAVFAFPDIDTYQSKRSYMRLIETLRSDPKQVSTLIHASHNRSLTHYERGAIWQVIWTKDAIPDEDIIPLIYLFEDNQSALASIISLQNVTVENLRYIYEKYKEPQGDDCVLDALANHPLTPDDILIEMLNQKDHFLVETVRERLRMSGMINSAEQPLSPR